MALTAHNHGPNFGRRVADCPRCTELDNGAEPRERQVDVIRRRRAEQREQDARWLRQHLDSAKHRQGLCNGPGLPCTYGES